jgi:MFS superfamily sulfate permease-like transporter
VLSVVRDRPPPRWWRQRWLVLDAQAMLDMDSSGAEAFHQAITIMRDRDVTLVMSRVYPPLRKQLRNHGLLEGIGEDRIFATNREAAAAFRKERG